MQCIITPKLLLFFDSRRSTLRACRKDTPPQQPQRKHTAAAQLETAMIMVDVLLRHCLGVESLPLCSFNRSGGS